jgi:epoxyqueuosine reductase
MDLKTRIRALAREHGFDVAGFTAPDLPATAQTGLQGFLGKQHHGDMAWMQENLSRRMSPRAIWPDVRSVIVLGHNYAPAANPLEKLSQSGIGNISCYAQGEDYHEVIKKKLKTLARAFMTEMHCEVKVFTDTAPVMEKPLAEKAGVGWVGKHTCVVSREFGSWLFLGEIFTTLDLPPGAPESDHCGSCTRCLDICPTSAFTAPRELDARRCISYLTIEHKGHIAREFRKAIGNRIYGCDDCLAVCPWNKFAQVSHESSYHPREELQSPLLAELVRLDDAAFRALFRKSPVKRTGRDRFIRNVLIAIGNSGDTAHIAHIIPLLHDLSPLVRAMAVWALGELASAQEYSTIRDEYLPQEHDPEVAAEWTAKAA